MGIVAVFIIALSVTTLRVWKYLRGEDDPASIGETILAIGLALGGVFVLLCIGVVIHALHIASTAS